MQSALKFVVKQGRDYYLNIFDSNETVEWKNVVQIIYNMINSEDV